MIGQTFGASDQSTTRTVLDVIFSPILAVGYIGSAVLIIMQKKLGKIASGSGWKMVRSVILSLNLCRMTLMFEMHWLKLH